MTAATFESSSRRVALVWAAIAVVVVLIVLGLRWSLPQPNDRAFDPRGNGRQGTKGLVTTLTELGAHVTVTSRTPQPGQYDAVLVDGGSGWTASRVRPYLQAGGTVLTTEPLLGVTATRPLGLNRSSDCPVPALAEVREVAGTAPAGYDTSRPGRTHCLTDEGGAAVVAVTPIGRGWMVSVAARDAFTNLNLAQDDNAVLATAVLMPRPGAQVAILNADADDAPADAGDDEGPVIGTESPVHPGIWLAVLQGFAVFVTAAFWQGRRLGRPIDEAPAVSLPGSELVASVGRLWHRARRTDDAGRVAVADARRRAADLLGIPRDAPIEAFVAAASRHGVPPERTARAFDPATIDDERDLVDRMADIDDVLGALRHPDRHQSVNDRPSPEELDALRRSQ